MNARGQRSYDRTLETFVAWSDRGGYIGVQAYKRIAERIGLGVHQAQRLVLTLESDACITREKRAGLASIFRLSARIRAVLSRRYFKGEVPLQRKPSGAGNAAASQPAPPSPPRPPWLFAEHLEQHPSR